MAPVVTTTSTRLNSAISRMPLRNPPGVSAPAAPKKTVHCGSVIEFSRTEAHMPSVRAWNEIRLYPSTRSATEVVFSRSRCSIGTDVSSFFVGFRMAMGAAIRAPAKRVRFSGFLLALDRFRDRPGFVPRTRADRVLVPIEKHVEIGILPLEFLDPLHDVFEGDRLVVRVDPQNNPFLALRPHGRFLSGSLQIIIRFFRAYKYSRAPRRGIPRRLRSRRGPHLLRQNDARVASSRERQAYADMEGWRIRHGGQPEAS